MEFIKCLTLCNKYGLQCTITFGNFESKFKKKVATPVVVGWFEGHTLKYNSKWFRQPSKLLCKLYSIQGVSRVKINILTRAIISFGEKCAYEPVSKYECLSR